MKTKFTLLSLLLMLVISVHAQDIQMTRTGRVTFHAGTSLEDIDASNNEVPVIKYKNRRAGVQCFGEKLSFQAGPDGSISMKIICKVTSIRKPSSREGHKPQ